METKAFYELINKVVSELKDQKKLVNEEWIDSEEAMSILKISSKSTLQKLRNNDDIKYSQPMKKHILYHKGSLIKYIEKHANERF